MSRTIIRVKPNVKSTVPILECSPSLICGNRYKLLRAFAPTGCPTRDRETYLPYLQEILGK